MTALGLLAVAIGAAIGAWLRWALGLLLNAAFPVVPPGTLAANLIGGFIIGGALQLFAHSPQITPEWRLLIVTGFCGGLTTFSTFSAELAALVQQDRYAWLAGAILLHVGGSLAATFAGIASMQWLVSR